MIETSIVKWVLPSGGTVVIEGPDKTHSATMLEVPPGGAVYVSDQWLRTEEVYDHIDPTEYFGFARKIRPVANTPKPSVRNDDRG